MVLTIFLVLATASGVQALADSDRQSEPATASSQETSSKAPRKGAGGTGSMADFLNLVNKRAVGVAAGRKIRLAVIPIKGTESPRYGDKGFGAFITEKISSSIGAPDSPIRLFERTRLDAVLKEQAFSASGIFDESEARKIGELAPLDYILTGTFTRLDQSIAINLRFIDVVSGEVRGNLSENLELTPDLNVLFEDLQAKTIVTTTPSKPGGTATSPCESKWAPIKNLMADIGTPAKLDKLVDAAVAMPFEPPCGDIHYTIISYFLRYKQYPPRYGQFLLQTLQKLENPDGDNRDKAILEYLMVPGQLEDPAWNATLRVAALSKRFYSYLGMLLADKQGTDASRRRLQERIGIILGQIDQKKIGRPIPAEPKDTFTDIMSALQHNFAGSDIATKDVRPLMNCYQAYGAKYSGDSDKTLLEILMAMYEISSPGADRERVLGWICERINQFPPSRDLESVLVTFLHELFKARTEARKKDISGDSAAQDLKRIASLSGKRIAETIPFILGRDNRLDVTGYCMENGIKSPGIIPDLDTLTKNLSSTERAVQDESVQLLTHLGPAALPAESAVLKILRRSSGKGAKHDLLGLLGDMQTKNPEAHGVLINYLSDIDSYVADEAVLALVKIGEPAAAALKAEFPKIDKGYKQMRVIKVFQLRGKSAAQHLPWLKSVMTTTKFPHVRDAAEDAIDAIS